MSDQPDQAFAQIDYGKYHWLHFWEFDLPHAEMLKQKFNFHELDLEDCLSIKIQQPKREAYDDYNFLVLHFPVLIYLPDGGFKIVIVQLNIFISATYLITISHNRLPSIENFFKDLYEQPELRKSFMKQGPGYLLYHLLERLIQQTSRIVEQMGHFIDMIDQTLFELRRRTIKDISLARRNLIVTSTTVKPMTKVFRQLEQNADQMFDDALKEYWSDIYDAFSRMAEQLADFRELLDGLSDAFDILLTHRTNQIMQMLTIFSVIMLPLTLISGIYGMNVPLPGAHSPATFGIIMVLMLIISLVMLLYFRKRGWI